MHSMPMVCHFILYIFYIYNIADNNVLGSDEGDAAESVQGVAILRAVRGRDALLPCGQKKIFLDGPEAYVLWLRNDRDFLYRFPNENSQLRAGTRNQLFRTSCKYGFCQEDTSLLIKKTTDRDAGLYHCRVHYQGSPSMDYVVNVKLVESTGFPKVYTGDGQNLKIGFVGPLSLGSDLTLICEVENKDPAKTQVSWRRNGVLVERTTMSCPGCLMHLETRLHNLTRGDLNAHYQCLVQNADVSEPLVASVFIRMYLPPLSVEIRMDKNYDFEAGQPRVADCVVVGCVPPPVISWHLGSTMVRPSVHKELHDGNYTVSSLTLAPSLHNDRNELVCTAYNGFMPNELFQDKVTINVGYRPTCQVGREEKIGAVVREAETVKCIVDASPEPHKFTWTFADSKTLYTSSTKVAGHRHRYSSTLTWLSRDGDIGMLLCRATNSFGEQKKACNYKISSGGPPELPECNVRRIYPNSLRVQCVKGWDGGRPQMIHLDIVDEAGTRIKNVSDSAGFFFLPNIVDQVNVTAVLYATNTRGKSDERTIYLHTLPAISEADNDYIQSTWMLYIEALAGIAALAIAAATIILVIRILLARRRREEIHLDIIPPPDGIFHREPDVIREERLLGTGRTNITVNQLGSRLNPYSSSLLPTCRLHGPFSPPDVCATSQHAYYV